MFCHKAYIKKKNWRKESVNKCNISLQYSYPQINTLRTKVKNTAETVHDIREKFYSSA